jgi:molybdate transport system substrate-binding protein
MIRTWIAAALLNLPLLAVANPVSAAELKFLAPTAMRAVMLDIVPQFERTSGHKVTVEFATVGVIADRLQKGEAADVTVVSGPLIENLQKAEKIVAGSRVDVARVGVGLFVRTGAPKPDIASVDSFKRLLQSAKSIGYGDPAAGGVSGVHMVSVVERLGLAAELKPKTKFMPNSQALLELVAKGEIEVGIGLSSDTVLVTGVDLVGAFPAELQNFTLYAAGLNSSSKQADAGNALIKFMTSPAGQAVAKAKGFEPR